MPYFANEGFFMPSAQQEYAAQYAGGYQPPSANQYAGPYMPLGPILPDPYDQYKNGPAPVPGYEHGAAYADAHHLMAAPYIPPVRIQSDLGASQAGYGRQYQHAHHAAPEKEDKPVGGVSAKLDYEMDKMTDFVTEMTTGMYELHTSRICIGDIDLIRSIKPGTAYTTSFRKWVLQVLNATRLPSATIILSMSYMALRVRNLSDAGRFSPSERSLYQMLTVALILGSKFLDDNTFQNKSWAEVSNIGVAELNQDEREWLSSFGHRLHHDPDRPAGFNAWLEQWRSFQTRAVPTAPTLHPLDTSIRRSRSIQSGLSAASYNQFYTKQNGSGISLDHVYSDSAYPSSAFASYDGWYGSRTASERSPSTAPHSSPHTPEYYGQQSMWNGYDLYAHRQQPALPSISSYAQPPAVYPSGWNLPSFTEAAQGYWNCHGAACQCGSCRAAASMLPPRYGSVMAG